MTFPVVKELLNRGADVNTQNKDGETALHTAVQNGNLETVTLLVEKGADTSIKDNHGKTPLDLAKKGRNKEIVTLLEPKSALAKTNTAEYLTRSWCTIL